jgi:hypothetical protein
VRRPGVPLISHSALSRYVGAALLLGHQSSCDCHSTHKDEGECRGASRIWRRGESIGIRTTRHGIEFTSDYQNSPIQHVIETGQWLDTILSEATDRRLPILATLRAQGITHYVMAPLVFSKSAPPEIQQHISMDIALHYGVAAYGNIGALLRGGIHVTAATSSPLRAHWQGG